MGSTKCVAIRRYRDIGGAMNYEKLDEIKQIMNQVFVGKEDVVEKLLICLLAGGHALIEDVPGVGKTTLASILSRAIECSFGRIQFTPDTLPGDILGMSVYNMKSGEFEFRKGVVMNQIILADEINRTSPKTQAGLLEAMEEGQITVDGTLYMLPQPFMVIATQNPIEFLGTYPLPETQMDRFLMRFTIGYPEKKEEIRMASQFLNGITKDKVKPVCSSQSILDMKKEVVSITVKDSILEYISDIIELTRKEERFVLGASPRAFLALVKASQTKAYMEKRDYVKPDDVKEMAMCVLEHRLVLTSEAKIRQENLASILRSLIIRVKVPT